MNIYLTLIWYVNLYVHRIGVVIFTNYLLSDCPLLFFILDSCFLIMFSASLVLFLTIISSMESISILGLVNFMHFIFISFQLATRKSSQVTVIIVILLSIFVKKSYRSVTYFEVQSFTIFFKFAFKFNGILNYFGLCRKINFRWWKCIYLHSSVYICILNHIELNLCRLWII